MQGVPTQTLAAYRPAAGRARAAQICLAAMGVLAVLSAIHFLSGFDLVERAVRGSLRGGEAEAFDDRTASLAQLGVVGLLTTGVLWFVWLHRAVANARALGRPTEFTPGWAVGWWFVPLANAVRPYQIIRSLVDALGAPDNSRVLWWWGSYFAAGFFAYFASFLRVPDLDGLRVFLGSSLIAEALRAAAAILAFRLVGEIERRSEQVAVPKVSPAYGSPSLIEPPAG